MRFATVASLLLLSAVALAGCTEEAPPTKTPQCTTKPNKTTLTMANRSNPLVLWNTSLGCFAAELYQDKVPITAGNFVNLTKSGFYNGTRFHRVIDQFMIQDGDPLSKDTTKKSMWGTGDPGYEIPDEFRPDLKHDAPGILSMANSGPNTGGSQYFVTLVPTPHLDPYKDGQLKKCGQRDAQGYPISCHAVFGKVLWNMATVQKIGKVPTDADGRPNTADDDRPTTDVLIHSVTIV